MRLLFFIPPFLFLLFAQTRILLAGAPLYPLELLSLPIFLTLILAWRSSPKDLSREFFLQDGYLLLGVTLFLLGALFSFSLHPVSAASLGILKSWFFFPTAFFLAGLYFSPPIAPLLKAWFCGLSLIALLAACGFAQGALTFDHRLAFPYSSPNFLAELIFPGMLLVGLFFFQERVSQRKRWLFAALLGFFLVLFFLTRSYNAWFAGIIAAGIFLASVWNKAELRRLLPLLGLALLLLMGAVFFSESGSEKWDAFMQGSERSSLASRITIWRVAEEMILKKPLFPVSLGGFQAEYLAYQHLFPPYLEWAVPQPHNLFLAFWLQTGLLGLIGFIILFSRLMQLLYRLVPANQEERAFKAFFLALWSFFILFSFFDTPYFRNDLSFLFWAQLLLSLLFIKKARTRSAL